MAHWAALSSMSRDRGVAEHRLAPGTLRRVARMARPYRGALLAFSLLLVVDALLVVVSPLALRRLIDDGVDVGDRRVVVTLSLLLAGVALITAVLSLLERWLSSRIGEGLIYDLRSSVFEHVQQQSIAFFTRSQTGALVSRLESDVLGAQAAFTSTASGIVSNGVTLVAVVIAMLLLSWPVTVLALLVVPLFLLPARRVGRRLSGLRRTSMQVNSQLAARMSERFNVAGALLVKLYGDLGTESAAYRERADAVRSLGVKTALSSRVFFTGLTALAALATAMVYGVGGWLAVAGSVSTGSLVALAALLGRLYGPITGLSNVQVDVMTALVAFERVFEILDLEPSVADPADPVSLPPGPLSIELRDVTFVYPDAGTTLASLEMVGTAASDGDPARAQGDMGEAGESGPVLRGVSVVAPAGSVVALVGPSGAGKTTITSLVARLYDVSSGSVLVGGVDVRHLSQRELHSRVGVVPQDAHLFHDTVRANLLYARPDASESQLWAALAQARAADVVGALPRGLDTVVGDRGHRLSGGEKQRVALARLLLASPSVVVLDEATAHLDSGSEAAVAAALDAALVGRTSLVIAHRLSTVRSADLIVVVDGGQVVEQGRHEELLARGGLYAELHRIQFAAGGAGVSAP